MKKIIKVRWRKDRDAWEVDWLGPRDGLRRRPLFATEELALQHASKIAKELEDGVQPVADRDIALKEYASRWLEARKTDIAARTYRTYDQSLKYYVIPKLGKLRVREIRPRHLLPWLAGLKQRKLAPDTVRLARAALSALMSRAVLEEIADHNPVMGLGREKAARGKLAEAREERIRPFASVEQRDEFLAVAMRPEYRPYGIAWAVMCKAGLRPGEAYALQPGDLDLKAHMARVERALDLDGSPKPTKTYERRTVRLSSSLVESLRRHLFWLKEETLRQGWGEARWLFPTSTNTPLDQSRATKEFHRAVAEAKLPSHVPYDCRHTYVCLMLSAGAKLGYVSSQIGHRTVATTLRHYYRWIQNDEGDQRQAEILEPKTGTNTLTPAVSTVVTTRNIVGGPSGTRTPDPLIKRPFGDVFNGLIRSDLILLGPSYPRVVSS